MENPIWIKANQRYSQRELAKILGVSHRTIVRWATGKTQLRPYHLMAISQLEVAMNPKPKSDFTFIDLFAGIGGTRLGFESVGGRCLFTSEWDRFSNKTYLANFNDDHEIKGDIREVSSSAIRDHDVLVAGFPCQPFSIAGVSKKNALGTPHGFKCETQGTLFFEIERIIREKKPQAFVLENVKNLKSHDKKRTFMVIEKTIESLGYQLFYRIVDAISFVPQHRERIFLVGFRKDIVKKWQDGPFDWEKLELPKKGPKLNAILHPEDGSEPTEEPFTIGPKAQVNDKYTLTDHLWAYLQKYADKHKAAGNGFGFGLVGPEDTTRTLSARYYKDGSEILVNQGSRKNPRRLTPRECARIMGFPDHFKIPVSDTQAYRQFGNSVVVPVVRAVAGIVKSKLILNKK